MRREERLLHPTYHLALTSFASLAFQAKACLTMVPKAGQLRRPAKLAAQSIRDRDQRAQNAGQSQFSIAYSPDYGPFAGF